MGKIGGGEGVELVTKKTIEINLHPWVRLSVLVLNNLKADIRRIIFIQY